MSRIRTIAKNTIVLAVAKVITMTLGMVLTVFIARSIGDVGFGKLGFAQSFTALLVIFADMGLSPVTIREIARHKDLTSKYLGNIFLIKLIFSIVSFSLIALIINLMHYPSDTITVVYLIGISSILNSFSAFMRAVFKAFEKMEYEAVLNIGKSVITFSIGFAVLFSGYGLIGMVLVYLLAAIIDLIATFVVTVKKFARPELKIDLSFWKQIILLAFPFLWTASIGTIYHRIDVTMLSVMKGDAQVGWYNAACNLIYALVIIPDMFSYAIFPVMSQLYVSSKEALRATLEKSAKYLFIVGLPLAVGIIILADRFILLIYGQVFAPSIAAMRVLALYLPVRFINHATGYALSSINKEHLRALSATTAAVTNIILNLFLIPKYGLIGAAVATAITEMVLFTCYYYFVAKHFYRLKLYPILVKPILACMAMGSVVFYLREFNISLLIISAAMIYFVALYLIKGFDLSDKAIFKDLTKGFLVKLPLNNKLVSNFLKR